jgi:hypothetical protein
VFLDALSWKHHADKNQDYPLIEKFFLDDSFGFANPSAFRFMQHGFLLSHEYL